jgi:tryptophanyl-tRNA synthetase
METKRKRLLSGVKPTGRPHLGNYLGALRQFVDLAKTHESFVFIADYHALNLVHDASVLRQNTIDLILDYLAIGLDPKEVVLFKQSDLAEHTELCWIFNTFTTMPYLMRAHAYKDAQAKNKEINVGTFDYPMLMAADILMYDPDIVPVGADQKQHVEYARDTAEKFNSLYGAPLNFQTHSFQKK